jgi:hypothetical protein
MCRFILKILSDNVPSYHAYTLPITNDNVFNAVHACEFKMNDIVPEYVLDADIDMNLLLGKLSILNLTLEKIKLVLISRWRSI